MDTGKVYRFLWFVEKYSYCHPFQDNELLSPEFTPEGQEGVSWILRFYPRRLPYETKGKTPLYLKRIAPDSGPEAVSLKFEISFLKVDGTTLYSEVGENTFRNGDEHEFKISLDMDKLYFGGDTEFLPIDSLGLCCTMWRGDGNFSSVVQCTARCLIGIETITFLHRVQNFSTLKQDEERTIQIPACSRSGCSFSSTLSISNTLFAADSIHVTMLPSDNKYNRWGIKLSLIDATENILEMGEIDYRFWHARVQGMMLMSILTRQFILNNKEDFLPFDELSLLCEFTFSTGVDFAKIMDTQHEVPAMSFNHRCPNARSNDDDKALEMLYDRYTTPEDTAMNHNNSRLKNAELEANAFSANNKVLLPTPSAIVHQKENKNPQKNKHNAAEKLSKCPNALDDFKALYNDQLFTDVVLKTATKSFAAHRIVLSARSSVFRAMLTSDTR